MENVISKGKGIIGVVLLTFLLIILQNNSMAEEFNAIDVLKDLETTTSYKPSFDILQVGVPDWGNTKIEWIYNLFGEFKYDGITIKMEAPAKLDDGIYPTEGYLNHEQKLALFLPSEQIEESKLFRKATDIADEELKRKVRAQNAKIVIDTTYPYFITDKNILSSKHSGMTKSDYIKSLGYVKTEYGYELAEDTGDYETYEYDFTTLYTYLTFSLGIKVPAGTDARLYRDNSNYYTINRNNNKILIAQDASLLPIGLQKSNPTINYIAYSDYSSAEDYIANSANSIRGKRTYDYEAMADTVMAGVQKVITNSSNPYFYYLRSELFRNALIENYKKTYPEKYEWTFTSKFREFVSKAEVQSFEGSGLKGNGTSFLNVKLLKHDDNELYVFKKIGKNTVVNYEDAESIINKYIESLGEVNEGKFINIEDESDEFDPSKKVTESKTYKYAYDVTITYEVEEGTSPKPAAKVIKAGTSIKTYPTVKRTIEGTEYTTNRWALDKNKLNEVTSSTTYTKNTVLYPMWGEVKDKCKVTFIAHNEEIKNVYVSSGESVPKSDFPPTPAGYVGETFKGWYVGATSFSEAYIINKDTIVIAVYVTNQPTITFSPDGCDWRNTPITVSATMQFPMDEYYGTVTYTKYNCKCHSYSPSCNHDFTAREKCTRTSKGGSCSSLNYTSCNCDHEQDCTNYEYGYWSCSGGTLTCSTCDGDGIYDCGTCGGDGEVTTWSYKQVETETNCGTCGGDGKIGAISCSACGGDGKVTKTEWKYVSENSPCTYCGGVGTFNCSRTTITCWDCSGTGTVGEECHGHSFTKSLTDSEISSDASENQTYYYKYNGSTNAFTLSCIGKHTHYSFCNHDAHSYPSALTTSRLGETGTIWSNSNSNIMSPVTQSFTISSPGKSVVSGRMGFTIDDNKVAEKSCDSITTNHSGDTDFVIQNRNPHADYNQSSNNIYKIDMNLPTISMTSTTSEWSNNDINYTLRFADESGAGISGLRSYSAMIKNESSEIIKSFSKTYTEAESTFSAVEAGTLVTSGTYTVNGSTSDFAGNLQDINSLVARIDKIAPIIKSGIENKSIQYNPNKDRYEVRPEYSNFYLQVLDVGGVGKESGLKKVIYKIVGLGESVIDGKDLLTDSEATILTNEQINTMKTKFLEIELPSKIKEYAKNIYLVVYAEDNAGNVAYTTTQKVTKNDMKRATISTKDGNKETYIGANDYWAATEGTILRKTPVMNVFMNSVPHPGDGGLPPDPGVDPESDSDPGSEGFYNEGGLVITKVYDVKWKGLYKKTNTEGLALYRNKTNDMIGLGYRVDFKYNTIGYNTEEGDTTEINIKVYRKVENQYKEVSIWQEKNGESVNITEFYSKYKFKKTASTLDYTGDGSDIPLMNYEYSIGDDGEAASIYFNYYIPANAQFRLLDGTVTNFQNNEILVQILIKSYKYMDYSLQMPFELVNDPATKWGSTGTFTTSNGTSKNVPITEGVGKGQVFWYDSANTALTDISGTRY